MNVLVVAAHHDDLELGCGGTVARLLDEGHRVVSLVMTQSEYRGLDGSIVRSRETAAAEAQKAAQILGFELISGNEDAFDIPACDSNNVKIANVIRDYSIDMVFTHWHGDTHLPHKRVNSMVLHACRHVPRLLGFASNWYVGEEHFCPRFFVAIDNSQWQRKLKALGCYESEFQRAGEAWVEYLRNQSLNYGRQLGVKYAEGFIVYRYLW
jgi:LmbE family N-acetylglucosaminyl deacetylase